MKRLSRKQRHSIARADGRLNIWHGSVRAGKSYAKLLRFAMAIAERPRQTGEYMLVAKTRDTMRRNVIRPLEELIGERNVSVNWGLGQASILGHSCSIISANDERAEQKVRGATVELVCGDEITLWPESLFDRVIDRMSVPGAQFFGDTNPDSPLHWLKVRWIDREQSHPELGLRSFHFSLLEDAPWHDPAYIASLKSAYTGLWFKRFVLGLWVVAEGAIWDSFDPDVHVIEDLPDDLEIREYWVGVDYGTANPFVALLFAKGEDGNAYVVDEYRWDSRQKQRQKTDAQYSADLKSWIASHEVAPVAWYVDPSAASFKVQLRQDHGWPVLEANNDVLDGIRFVGKLWAKRLRILSTCAGLIGEIPSYSWDPKAQDKGEDKPIKAADHGPDALRYGGYTHLKKRDWTAEDYGWVA